MATPDRLTATLALAHALSAAERGLPVIPLSRTKLPALPSPHREEPPAEGGPCRGACGFPGHGVHDASTDPTVVRALFAAAPWATGYGIACGRPPHHLIGIDLDTKHGADPLAALQRLAEENDFTVPTTLTVLTPSGGRHLWLSGPPGVTVPNSASRLAPGIDVRGTGGYLVGPGSLTSHGVYRLAPGTAHLPAAPCPPPLLTLLTPERPERPERPDHPPPPSSPLSRTNDGHGLVEFVRTAREGQRNTRLFWAACRAYENGLGPTLTAPLTEAALHTGLTLPEIRSTLASAARLTAGTKA
ncbi:bifunctional DNA primase/polymerase [Streptomyces sp. NBC_00237]|uniref:bifunctional DNA primase/polymerase n=1 Tax=Streptomyces sp. NBC_00237 TaxID=2975687 RepID=UPI00224C9647|nr:bifunctional DNA primase/polymerase [Streptomyces sp. NBC_00237]MCX5199969.1 bifunctional DNA primase/polymerase [Streptomyces sp. NBC_00237]